MKYLPAGLTIVGLALMLSLAWWMALCVPTPAPPLPAEQSSHSILENPQ